jgi:hypothetical protein
MENWNEFVLKDVTQFHLSFVESSIISCWWNRNWRYTESVDINTLTKIFSQIFSRGLYADTQTNKVFVLFVYKFRKTYIPPPHFNVSKVENGFHVTHELPGKKKNFEAGFSAVCIICWLAIYVIIYVRILYCSERLFKGNRTGS